MKKFWVFIIGVMSLVVATATPAHANMSVYAYAPKAHEANGFYIDAALGLTTATYPSNGLLQVSTTLNISVKSSTTNQSLSFAKIQESVALISGSNWCVSGSGTTWVNNPTNMTLYCHNYAPGTVVQIYYAVTYCVGWVCNQYQYITFPFVLN